MSLPTELEQHRTLNGKTAYPTRNTKNCRSERGNPLGRERFERETGITVNDWYTKYWIRWGDALREAGYSPNELQDSCDEGWIVEKLIDLIRELGRFPLFAELRMRSRGDETFPSHSTFHSRLGRKNEQISRVVEYCTKRDGNEDVLEICEPLLEKPSDYKAEEKEPESVIGYVYLMKSEEFYKIGRTNSLGRREYELALQLPEEPTRVHVIKTDDPVGIEEYWHKRFAHKRRGGEWFVLDSEDIKAFKRRRFM